MQKRINEHKLNRAGDFIIIEEPLKLYETILTCQEPILLECVSMWINNMLYHEHDFKDMTDELNKIMKLKKSIVFVLNDVGSAVIPENQLAREFVDISGKLSQLIASNCDEVYHTIAGISTKIK